jgi:hypothetical protein
VQAFPDRVATCELDLTSTGRPSFRLKRKFDLDVSPQVLLTQLTPLGQEKRLVVTQIWPTGPVPRAGYTKADVLLEYGNNVLFIAGTYAGSASDTYLSAVRSYGLRDDVALTGMVIALWG